MTRTRWAGASSCQGFAAPPCRTRPRQRLPPPHWWRCRRQERQIQRAAGPHVAPCGPISPYAAQCMGSPMQPPCAPHPPPLAPQRAPLQIVRLRRSGKAYVLYQCGTPNPTALPAGAAEGVAPGMPAFEIPLHSVAVTDTTVNGFLVRMGSCMRQTVCCMLHARMCMPHAAIHMLACRRLQLRARMCMLHAHCFCHPLSTACAWQLLMLQRPAPAHAEFETRPHRRLSWACSTASRWRAPTQSTPASSAWPPAATAVSYAAAASAVA